MANLDNLLGSHLSLISLQDVRYDGILFSINSKESSIVLRDVKCLGTEDRVSDPSLVVAANSVILTFVTFPGHEIKDLYVHENSADTPPPPPVAESTQPPPEVASKDRQKVQQNRPPAVSRERENSKAPNERKKPQTPKTVSEPNSKQPQPKPTESTEVQQLQKEQREPRRGTQNQTQGSTAGGAAAGTGEHLLRLRVKKGDNVTEEVAASSGEFDFAAGLSSFNKTEVLATVANENTDKKQTAKYVKDDFFDSLSCDILDREEGRSSRLNPQEERSLNQDTFGAIALQPNYRRNYRGGGNSSGYNGRGGGGRGYRGRGGGYRGRGGRGRDARVLA